MLIRVSHCLPAHNQYFPDCGIEITGEIVSKIGRWDDHFANREPDLNFAEAVAVPGLINAHCHLDFSNLKDMIPAQSPFAEWIGKLVNIGMTGGARKLTEADYQKNVVDQIATGTTAIFDVSVTGLAPSTPIQVIPFFEMVGFRPEQVETRTGLMKAHLEKFKERRPVGISPHTPYTTLKNYFDFAYQNADYVMTHVAESEFENEFMQNRTGPIADFLKTIAPDVAEPGALIPKGRSWEVLKSYGIQGKRTLLIHGNYLSDSELDEIAAGGATVVICPKCHAYFGHSQKPWVKMINRHIPMAIGTDSLASNDKLSMHAEMIHLAETTRIPLQEIFKMATLNAAKAVGLEKQMGSLEVGKLANLAIFDISQIDRENPLTRWLDAKAFNLMTLSRGIPVFRVV